MNIQNTININTMTTNPRHIHIIQSFSYYLTEKSFKTLFKYNDAASISESSALIL